MFVRFLELFLCGFMSVFVRYELWVNGPVAIFFGIADFLYSPCSKETKEITIRFAP